MKSVFRPVTLLVLAALVVSICGCAPVTIQTLPEDAAVYPKGGSDEIGSTPYKTRVFFSDREFELRKEGFYDENVLIDDTTPPEITVDLRPLPVLVRSEPAADIYELDGVAPIGITPLEVAVKLEPRTCILMAKDHFDKKITIGLETESPMVVELERRPIVTLTTIPAGVDIYENERHLGTSTLREEINTPRQFELRKEGYYSKTLNLTSASPAEMSVELTPLPIITIETEPEGAAVYLLGSDTSLGDAPLTLTIEKSTAFEVRMDRYYPQTFTVKATTQTNSVTLSAMPYVTIGSDPAGAQVILNGTPIGTTPVEQLIEKPATAELRLDGYQIQTVTLSGSDLSPVITLKKEAVAEAAPAAEVPAPAAAEEPAKKKSFRQKLFGK